MIAPLVRVAALALLVAPALAQAPAADPSGKLPPRTQEEMTDLVRRLTPRKLDAVLAALGLETPKDLYGCICSQAPHTPGVGVRYDKGQCEFAGLGVWRERVTRDPKTWSRCVDAHRLADGRSVVEAVADAAALRRKPAVAAAPDANEGQKLRAEIEALRKVCLPLAPAVETVLRAYEADFADYQRRKAERADRAANLPGKPIPAEAPPYSEGLVKEMRAAIAAAPNPCEQAAEASLVAEKAALRSLGDYAMTLAGTVASPGGGDALDWIGKLKRLAPAIGLVEAGGTLVDVVKESRAQDRHKLHAEAIEEARELIRVSRGWTADVYRETLVSYEAEVDDLWKAVSQAARTLEERLADIERRRRTRPPGDALAQRQYDDTLANETVKARADRSEAMRLAFARMDEIKFLRDALERFRKPALGRSCEQWMAAACGAMK
ncbi:MAG: hypothetical protein IPL88_16025 [Rhizobiales bacterium]|nr:hypothetical protein [Hyphomicrobiales bacterium]